MKEKRGVYLLDPKWGNCQCCQILCDASVPLFNCKISFEFPMGRGYLSAQQNASSWDRQYLVQRNTVDVGQPGRIILFPASESAE